LIDGIVKQLPKATAEIDTPFYECHAKALCVDKPVQEVITGDIPGALGSRQHSYDRIEVTVLGDAIDKIINGS